MAVAACSTPDSSRVGASADTTPASPRARESTAWYERVRALDLTAVGDRADSLQVTLRLVVDGAQVHEETWGSSYELALVDSAVRLSPAVDSVLRARLDSVLASVALQPIGAPGARLMAEDSALLAGISQWPTHQVSFRYGYETMTRLAWDASRRQFVRLWSCC